MYYLKAFIAGITFPSIFLPLALITAWLLGKTELLTIPFLHILTLVWGIWNVLYFAYFRDFFPKNQDVRLILTGALLGLLVALGGVFWLHLPEVIGLPATLIYFPLVGGPLLYALLWRFVVKPLNSLLGLHDY